MVMAKTLTAGTTNIGSTITQVPQITFAVTGGTGKYRYAKSLIIDFYNEKYYDQDNKDLHSRKCTVYA